MMGQEPQARGSGRVSAVAVMLAVGEKTGEAVIDAVGVALEVGVGEAICFVGVEIGIGVLAAPPGEQAANPLRRTKQRPMNIFMIRPG